MRPSLRRVAHTAARQGGAIMMFILLVALLLSVVTLGVLRLVSGDITEGFGGLEAVQAFNVAEAGVHYAIGQLQITGTSNAYAGGTLTVTSGSTTVGTATITVNCIDTGAAPPCSGTYAAYRRIVSTSTLPSSGASGGPTRTIVVVIQSTQTVSTYGICAGTNLVLDHWSPINANVGSNGSLSMDSQAHVYKDTVNTPPQFTGMGAYYTTISCEATCSPGGAPPTYELDAGATLQATKPCPAMVAPVFNPNTGNPVTVIANTVKTLNSASPGWPRFGDVVVQAGIVNGGYTKCNSTTDLQIDGGSSGTTIVYMNTLVMNTCSRFIILNTANIDLRIGSAVASSTSGLQLGTGTGAPVTPTLIRFGVKSPIADSWAPNVRNFINPNQLTVSVNSTSASNPYPVSIWGVDYVYANFLVPNGMFYYSGVIPPTAPALSEMSGNINALQIDLEENGRYDSVSGGGGGGSGYTLFNNLRSWKDQ